ncbi:MAG: hypothetical protein Q9160_000734 [Pyrenula sp. 1 TL-2023]
MAPNTLPNPLIAIIGATGTGKSKLAVSLAQRFNGEIINGDAMQMYQGLPIITNKIPVAERGDIPHHLIDLVGYDEPPWHVGTFVRESLKITKAIHQKGKIPILVGGTHYYTKGLLFQESLVSNVAGRGDEQVPEPEGEWPILSAPTSEILAQLKEVDPVMAHRWHPNERRKIRRSLEIWLQTGRPASDIYAEQMAKRSSVSSEPGTEQDKDVPSSGGLRYPTLIFWLKADKDALSTRLNTRVDEMVNEGLIQESETLHDFAQSREQAGIEDDMTRGIWVSIGYKELLDYIAMYRQGNASIKHLDDLKEDCVERIKIATRQYAKRQERFIRIRLMDDIVRSNASDNLFILDCSNTSTLEADMMKPAACITSKFLQGEQLPDPRETSTLARETLSSIAEAAIEKERGVVPQCCTCETCGKVLETAKAWENHLKSKRHRQRLVTKKRKETTGHQTNGEGTPDRLARNA